MRTATLMLAVLTVGACVRQVDPTEPKTWGNSKEIWLFVAPRAELEKACAEGVLPPSVLKAAGDATPPVVPASRFDSVDVLIPTEILVGTPTDARMPFSCVDRQWFEHKVAHDKHGKTMVKLSQYKGNYAVYRSLAPFKVLAIGESGAGTPPAAAPAPGAAQTAAQRPGVPPARASERPEFPFFRIVLNPPTQAALIHRTGPIDASVNRVSFPSRHIKFKVVFEVAHPTSGVWFRVDPDIECKFAGFKI